MAADPLRALPEFTDWQIVNALDAEYGEESRLFELIGSAAPDESPEHKVRVVRALLSSLAKAPSKGAAPTAQPTPPAGDVEALAELRRILGLTDTDLTITLQCAITRIRRLASAPREQVASAFDDLGFEWHQMLQGHVHDGRDVGRTLTAPQFEAIGVDPAAVDAFDSKDSAIVKAKAEIKRALAAAPAAVVDEAAVAWRVRVHHRHTGRPHLDYWSRWQIIDKASYDRTKAEGAYYEYDTFELQELGVIAAALGQGVGK